MNPLDSFEAFQTLVHSETLVALRTGDVEKIVFTMQSLGSKDPARLLHFVNGRVDEASRTPLHVLSEFSSDLHLTIAALIVENKADINARDRHGNTPLHSAAATSNCEMVCFLGRRGDIRLNAINKQGLTPLHAAIACDSVECVSILLGAGACSTIRSTSSDAPVSTPADLVIAKHASEPMQWDAPKKLVDLEARFVELFSDPAVCDAAGVLDPGSCHVTDEFGYTLSRLENLVGSLQHSSRSIALVQPESSSRFLDMGEFALLTEQSSQLSLPEQLYRLKQLQIAPTVQSSPSDRQQSQSHKRSPHSHVDQPSPLKSASKHDTPSCVTSWACAIRQQRHHLADAASSHVAAHSPLLTCLDTGMSSVSKLAITSSTLQKICTAALCAPLLESLCIRNTVVINDTDVSILIDWLPMLLRYLESSESHSIDAQGAGGLIKKLSINNCKLIPSMYYTSMQFPLGIVELDFSCNPDLGLSGVAYILAAIKDKQFTRRIVFSRCTLESAAGAACDSHLAILVECFPQFKSLELVDLSFNFFNISQLLQIITALPACISTLQLCGLEFLNDFNGFASALKAGFGHLGPCLRTVLLSHNATLVSLPTTMSVCENISYLDISFCSNLKYIPDELFVPALSVLIAHNNPSLEYVGLLPGKSLNLSFVDLSSCTSLQTLPDEIYVATLEVLLLCHNTALKNIAKVGTGIVNAVRLRCIDLTNCTQLSSLPDQLASDCLSNLDSIIIKGCSSMVYPPSNSVKKTQHIKDYLKSAKDQPPLKRVKVVLLGNGRSGKTSLLGALAKRELDVECPSTKGVQVDMFAKKLQPQSSRKSFAKFVGASLSKFAPEVTCAPSHPALCSFDHMTRYWDFAGQLEYSATHDFFMSSRQAVYVIVFSVADHASSQADQVRYWLNTILARHSMHNRIMVVGTKIDVIDTQLVVTDERDLPRLREAALKRHEKMMRQCVDSVTCNYNISFTIPILFTTADKKHPLWRQKRKNVKSQISQFSQDIFDFCEGQLRFPAIHKALFYEVQELAKQHPHKPVFSLDDPCITPKSKLLYALRGSPDGRSLQSLDILSDVGLLVHYNCKGQDYICPTPQYVANLVSLLADPDRICQPVITEQELRKLIYINYDVTKCAEGNDRLANQLIDFMLEIRLVTEAKSSNPSRQTNYLIPLQLRGRPSFWQDCDVPIDTDAKFTAVRFKLSRGMVTVASFLRLMTEMCHDIVHMWGCAFISKLKDSEYVFVRVSEDRSVVDVVTLTYSAQAAETVAQTEEICLKIISKLNFPPETSTKVFLCPHCVSSNHYMRSGFAHEFYPKHLDGILSAHVTCRRGHESLAADIINGTVLHFKGSNKMPLLFPGCQANCIAWVSVSDAGITNYSDPGCCDDEAHSGTVLPSSFFALSEQLEPLSNMTRTNLERLLSSICANAPACPISLSNDDMQMLRLQFAVGDCIGARKINRIIDMQSALVVASSSSHALPGRAVVVTSTPHNFSQDQRLVVDAACRGPGATYGHDCSVEQVVDERAFVIVFSDYQDLAWDNSSCLHMLSPATKIYRICSDFSCCDNVLVIFENDASSGANRPKFKLFPGRPSSGLQAAFLTRQSCCSGDLGLVWAEVEDNWAVMLGNEYPNYEIDTLTLFRNQDREQLFLHEVNWLKTVGQARRNPYRHPFEAFMCPDDDERQRVQRSAQQRQVLSHFHDFQSKFCLLPLKENDGVNLSVVWWGHSPEAHFATAQNGFQHLPPGLKMDLGYFGEGFYLTRYPRYSDYYTSGCNLSSRAVCGSMLMSFAALGRPYPVTQCPFEFVGDKAVKTRESLLGEACGALCNCYAGSDCVPNHDCHFASVKFQSVRGNAAAKSFFPCPHRQEPEYDEIVVFKSERVVPTAHVTFTRRPRVLLWLDEEPQSADNVKIKCDSIPGYAESNLRSSTCVSRGTAHANDDSHAAASTIHVPDSPSQAGGSEGDASHTIVPTLLHEFVTVDAIADFLRAHTEFTRYPSSLFRIITSQRLYVGSEGLASFLDSEPLWSSAYPSIMLFQSDGAECSHATVVSRPGFLHTRSVHACCAFASFLDLRRA